ncbi:MarR family winged helix-turn-helix transcriptional regulator [Novispirillum sp. DQ9]|uniref:MarR family winged helix-turn-helix transcriptional regulator n=1 Tax=Novispirillum sp. DQ9 TaxID=3398612 RepID=UPI003C7DF6B5
MNFTALEQFPPHSSEIDSRDISREEVGHLLRRAHQRATAILSGAFGPDGFTPPQFAVLSKLLEAGCMSQNSLGRAVAMDAATTQGVVRRLIDRDMVTRAADPADRRRVKLSLTATGRRAVQDILDRATAAEHAILSPLSPRERQTLMRLLRRIA